MKKILFLLIVVFCSGHLMTAQELRPVATDILEQQQRGSFENPKNVFNISENRSNVGIAEFIDPEHITFLDYDFSKLPENAKNLSIEIPTQKGTFKLLLTETDPTLFDFEITTSSGTPYSRKISKPLRYHGILEGNIQSLVILSFYEGKVKGIISNALGNFNIGTLGKTNQLAIYNEVYLKNQEPFVCNQTEDSDFKGYDPEVTMKNIPISQTGISDCVNVYLETEFDMLQEFSTEPNPLTALEDYMADLFHEVAVVYYNDGIALRISNLFIWEVEDPYTSASAVGRLAEFQSVRGFFFPGNVGQLFTFEIFNDFGGLADTIGANICSVFGKSDALAVSRLRDFEIPIAANSFNARRTAHEFGHLLGSRHTAACIWFAGDQQIDDCLNVFQFNMGDTPEGDECFDVFNPTIPFFNGGTIMSACQLTGTTIPFGPNAGQNLPGVVLANGFGVQPRNVIRNHVDNSSCLSSCTLECNDLCDIEADFTAGLFSNLNQCRYRFSGENLQNPMCANQYNYSWVIEGVPGIASTSQTFLQDFSGFDNGTYDVTLTITYIDGLQLCSDSFTDSITITCGNDTNPTCPSSNFVNILEAEPCIDYLFQAPFDASIDHIDWYYNIHGVAGPQFITTTNGPGPYSVPVSLPSNIDFDNDFLWAIAEITLVNDNTCERTDSRLLSCPGGGGGIGIFRASLYPNPSKGIINIDYEDYSDITSITVRNIYGNIVLSRKASLGSAIDLSNQPKGMYFTEIKFKDGKTQVLNVILN